MIPAGGKRPENQGRNYSGSRDQNTALWGKAVRWVNANRLKILANVRKYEPYSPYAREDFLQTAYIAAFEAARETEIRKTPGRFEPFFWTCMKKHGCRMATDPNVEDTFGVEGCRAPVLHVEYTESGDDESPPTPVASHLTPELEVMLKLGEEESVAGGKGQLYCIVSDVHAAKIKRVIRSRMTRREALVWEYLLGLAGNEGRITLARAAQKLGYGTRQSIARVRDRGLRRLMESMSCPEKKRFHQLRFDFEREGKCIVL